jgi:hypothetical protein
MSASSAAALRAIPFFIRKPITADLSAPNSVVHAPRMKASYASGATFWLVAFPAASLRQARNVCVGAAIDA